MTTTMTHMPRSLGGTMRVLSSDISLRWHERVVLGVAIIEICLQIDSYLMYHLQDASLGSVGGINVSLMTFCLVYLYGVWIANAMVSPSRPRPAFLLNVPMLLYIAVAMLSITVAAVRLLAVFDVIVLLQAFALFFYLANRILTERDVVACVMMLCASMAIQSLLVVGLAAFGSADSTYSFGPIDLVVWEDGRPGSTVHSPVAAGSLLAIMWIPVMTMALSARRVSIRILCGSATALGMLAILLTQTRGAIITAAVGALMIGALMARRAWLPKWSIVAAVLLAIIGAYPLFNVITTRVTGDDEGSASARKHLAAIAWETIKQAPIAGHGAGNCHLACQDVASTSTFRSEWYYTIHCKYLIVWVETGIIGLITFLLVLGNGIRHGLLAWMDKSNPMLATLGLGCAAAIVGHMTHMLVDVFNSRCQVHLLWAVLGITAAIYNISRQSKKQQVRGGQVYGS